MRWNLLSTATSTVVCEIKHENSYAWWEKVSEFITWRWFLIIFLVKSRDWIKLHCIVGLVRQVPSSIQRGAWDYDIIDHL